MPQETQNMNFADNNAHVALERNSSNSFIVNPVRLDQNANITATKVEMEALASLLTVLLESGKSQQLNFNDNGAHIDLSKSGSVYTVNGIRTDQNVNISATAAEVEALRDLVKAVLE